MERLNPDKHREYLSWQILEWLRAKSESDDFIVLLDGDVLEIRSSKSFYKESIFDPQYLDGFLDELSQSASQPDSLIERHINIPFCAALDWFWREGYLDPKVSTDQHDRITAPNISSTWRKTLEWPIFDMLLIKLLDQLQVPKKQDHEVIFTCDYDVTDFWGNIGPVRSLKQVLGTLKESGVAAAQRSFRSWRLRNEDLTWNGSLNRKMFPEIEDELPNVVWRNIAFLLIHQSDPKFDPTNDMYTPAYQQFFAALKERDIVVAMHPAYQSRVQSSEALKQQIDKLQLACEEQVLESRFHYLNASMPEDFLLLEKAGLIADHSYAFPDDLLFRGGRSFPCRYWSFAEGRGMKIISYPLTLMDVTLSHYQGNRSNNRIEEHLDRAWEFGNSIDVLFHNQYFDPFIRYPDKPEVQAIFDKTCNHLKALAFGKIRGT